MGLLGHMVVLFPVFQGISTLFSIVAVLVCIPTNSVRGFPFLHTLSSIYCFLTFDGIHSDPGMEEPGGQLSMESHRVDTTDVTQQQQNSDWHEMVAHCGFE